MPKLLMIAALMIGAAGLSLAQTPSPVGVQPTTQVVAPAKPDQPDQDRAAWFGNAVGHILESE